jgi:hypothetical protein
MASSEASLEVVDEGLSPLFIEAGEAVTEVTVETDNIGNTVFLLRTNW